MMTVDELDEKFGIEGELGFTETEGELIAISIFNKYVDAEICLYGAHVTRYMPHGTFDALWVSPASLFEVGKPIRGGIPVCFPWFGPHPSDSTLPIHGFIRLMYWEVMETASLESGETLVKLKLCSNNETKKYWPYDFNAIVTLVAGKKLDVTLSIINTGTQSFEYSAAFHSYFNISGIENIAITGLEGVSYYSGASSELFKQETQLLTIDKEENRRYIDTTSDCLIVDPLFNQAIRIAKRGSMVTVVWNPGEETTAKIGDIPNDGFHEFVCVETVNACNNTITLNPGEEHSTSTIISIDHKAGNLGLGARDDGFSVV
jgi:glucose-6-phosphate 1-epimerase